MNKQNQFNEKDYKIYYKRNLPHYQPPGYTFFVTFRLTGSLPLKIINTLKLEKENAFKVIAECRNANDRKEKYYVFQSHYFAKFDKLLDESGYGPKWLGYETIGNVVAESIHFYDSKTYSLICFTIMPNHVHMVFKPIVGRISDSTKSKLNEIKSKPKDRSSQYLVSKALQNLKRYTAVKCNKLLNRSGQFWQHESYDHVVRNESELHRIIKYTLNNPVKARLCEEWDDWNYSYYNFKE